MRERSLARASSQFPYPHCGVAAPLCYQHHFLELVRRQAVPASSWVVWATLLLPLIYRTTLSLDAVWIVLFCTGHATNITKVHQHIFQQHLSNKLNGFDIACLLGSRGYVKSIGDGRPTMRCGELHSGMDLCQGSSPSCIALSPSA